MLIPVHFSISGSFNFDNSSATNPNYATGIAAGNALQLYTSSVTTAGVAYNKPFVKLADSSHTVVGIAGDNYRSDVVAATAGGASAPAGGAAAGYASAIVINGNGDTTLSQNRISDLYKETLASGMMTVYSGVGTFRTDQYLTADAGNFVAGDLLYAGASGLLTRTQGSGGNTNGMGRVIAAPLAFPSGVPGVGGTWGQNWIDNSMALNGGNSSQLLTFTLNC